MDILAELTSLKASYASLQEENAKLSTAQASLDALTATVAEKDKAFADLQAAFDSQAANLSSANDKLAEVETALSELKASQTTAEKKAVEMVASLGVAPLKVDSQASNEALTKEDAFAKYQELAKTDTAKAGAYLQKHMGLFVS